MSDCKIKHRQIARVSVNNCMTRIAVGLLSMDFQDTL